MVIQREKNTLPPIILKHMEETLHSKAFEDERLKFSPVS